MSKNKTQQQIEQEEQEKLEKYWLRVERSRKEREKYEMKPMSVWLSLTPLAGIIIAIIAGVIIWISGDANTESLWQVVGVSLSPLLLLGITGEIEKSWKASLRAKEKIHEQKFGDLSSTYDDYSSFMTLNDLKYKYEYLYTDNRISYWFYQITKFILGALTLALGLLLVILIFGWLGSISIAPTTIIIILLVIILFRMK